MNTRMCACVMLTVAIVGMVVGCEGQSSYSSWSSGRGSSAAAPPPVASPPPAANPPAPAPRTSGESTVGRASVPEGTGVAQLAVPTGQAANSPLLVETFAPQDVLAGSTFDYRIRLTNLSEANLEGVVVTAGPLDFETLAMGPRGRVDARRAIWDPCTIEPRGVKFFVLRGKAAKIGNLTPCVDVTFRNPRVCMPVRVVQPALHVAKTGPMDVLICDPITWRIVVTNAGTGTARNVVVRDDLPEGLTAMDGGTSVVVNAGDLPGDRSKEILVQARAARPGKYVGKAVATSADGLSATSDDVTTTVHQPMLVVTKTGPETRYVGRPMSYTVTVKNTGDGEARDTVLTDTIPPGMTLTGATEGGRQTPDGKIVWNLGALPPGAETKVVVSGTAGGAGTLSSSVVARAKCAEGSASAVTAVRGVAAILLEMVDDPDPVEIGTTTTYTTTITNQGTAADGNVVVKCIIPEEEAYVSATGPTQETVDGGTVTFAPLPSLAPKDKAVYKIVVKGVKAGDVRFKVLLTSDMMTTPAMKTESTHIYE